MKFKIIIITKKTLNIMVLGGGMVFVLNGWILNSDWAMTQHLMTCCFFHASLSPRKVKSEAAIFKW